MLVAGVDTSTQSCKVVVLEAATGRLVREGRADHPAGTEIHPDHWWRAFRQAADAAGGLADVAALAVGGQQHGMVALDVEGRVIRDALLWNDTRSAAAARDLIVELGRRSLGLDRLDDHGDPLPEPPLTEVTAAGAAAWAEATGSVPVASLTLTKLRWLHDAEPENAARVAAVALPHDWLTWRIAGYGPAGDPTAPLGPDLTALRTDRSDASGTGYFDASGAEGAGVYRLDLLELALGRADVLLPRVLGPAQSAGVAHPEIAGADIPEGALLGPGAGDNAAAALGLGMETGDVAVSVGTSGVASAIGPHQTADPSGLVTGFADATGQYLPLACTLNASRVLDAGRELLGVSHEELSELALQASPGAGGLTLVPYLEGERTPNRPDASGTLHGLRLDNATRPDLARAFVEGLLCLLADGVDALRAVGVPVKRFLLLGGGARSEALRRLAPGILAERVWVPEPGEYVALGAARQAAWVLAARNAGHDGGATVGSTPPRWPLEGVQCYDGEPHPQVRANYAAVRDAL